MIPSDQKVLEAIGLEVAQELKEFALTLKSTLLLQAMKEKKSDRKTHFHLAAAVKDLGDKIHCPAEFLKAMPVLEKAAMRDVKQNVELSSALQQSIQLLLEIGQYKRERNRIYWLINHNLMDKHMITRSSSLNNVAVERPRPHDIAI